MRLHPVWRYVLVVLALMPITFVLWVYVDAWLSAPARMLAVFLLEQMPEAGIAAVQQQGDGLLVLSRYGESGGVVLAASEAGHQLAVTVNMRLMSYSLPFFAALHFAVRGASLSDFASGLLVLWGLIAMGLVLTALKSLALAIGPERVYGELPLLREICLLGYQFSVLLAPTLVPVLLVAWNARGLWEAFMPATPAAKGAGSAAQDRRPRKSA